MKIPSGPGGLTLGWHSQEDGGRWRLGTTTSAPMKYPLLDSPGIAESLVYVKLTEG